MQRPRYHTIAWSVTKADRQVEWNASNDRLGSAMSAQCPLFPTLRTQVGHLARSEECHQPRSRQKVRKINNKNHITRKPCGIDSTVTAPQPNVTKPMAQSKARVRAGKRNNNLWRSPGALIMCFC